MTANSTIRPKPRKNGFHWTIFDAGGSANETWQKMEPMLEALADGDGPFHRVKDGPRKVILCGPDPLREDCELWIKRYYRPHRPFHPRRLLFGIHGPGEAEASRGLKAAKAGVPASEVVACGHRVHGGQLESILVCRSPRSARRLGAVLAELDWSDSANIKRAESILSSVFRVLHNLHDSAGLVHRDINMGNVLVHGPQDDVLLIDFHRCRPLIPGWRIYQRTEDITKLHHFLEAHFTKQRWLELLDAYTQGDTRLLEAIRSKWDTVKKQREERKILGVVQSCLRSRVYFVWDSEPLVLRGNNSDISKSCQYKILHDRDFSRESLDEFLCRQDFSLNSGSGSREINSGGNTRDCTICTYSDKKSAREAWCDFVERACRAKGSGEIAPLALMEPKEDNAPVYIVARGAEHWPKGRPRYALSWVFSLERFSESAFQEVLGRRTDDED